MTRFMTAFFATSIFAFTIVTATAPASAQGFSGGLFGDLFAPRGAPQNMRPQFDLDNTNAPGPIPRAMVNFPGNYTPGTIVISTTERRLYLVTGRGRAIRYGVGVGRDGFGWHGVHHVSAKKEWPSWTPPIQMIRRRPDLPRYMPGGEDNPLGARAMYLGSTLYRIHGSNEPESIGQAVSSGCFRLLNEDVIDLYDRVSVGATVIVKN